MKRYAAAYENGIAIPKSNGDYVLYSDYAVLEKALRECRDALRYLCNGGSGDGRASEWDVAERALAAASAVLGKESQ